MPTVKEMILSHLKAEGYHKMDCDGDCENCDGTLLTLKQPEAKS